MMIAKKKKEPEEEMNIKFTCPTCKDTLTAEVNIKDIAYNYLDTIVDKIKNENRRRP